MKQVTREQIIRIHTLKSQLMMDDETYRLMLSGFRDATTSKDLTYYEAAELIRSLEDSLPPDGEKKHDDLRGKRDDRWPTPKQLRLLEFEWSRVTRAPAGEAQEKALNGFLHKRGFASNIRMLDKQSFAKALYAVRHIKPATKPEDEYHGQD